MSECALVHGPRIECTSEANRLCDYRDSAAHKYMCLLYNYGCRYGGSPPLKSIVCLKCIVSNENITIFSQIPLFISCVRRKMPTSYMALIRFQHNFVFFLHFFRIIRNIKWKIFVCSFDLLEGKKNVCTKHVRRTRAHPCAHRAHSHRLKNSN